MNNNTEIPIFFAIDDGYTPFLAVALKSLLVNASKDYNYSIKVLHTNVEEAHKNQIKKFECENVNVEFESGKIHGIVGMNGSGKTMLFKCICGFVRPDSGCVYVNGKRIGKDIDFPEDTGFIIETPGFLPDYTGFQNLKMLADVNRKIGAEEIKRTLERVGLDPYSKKQVKKYSQIGRAHV